MTHAIAATTMSQPTNGSGFNIWAMLKMAPSASHRRIACSVVIGRALGCVPDLQAERLHADRRALVRPRIDEIDATDDQPEERHRPDDRRTKLVPTLPPVPVITAMPMMPSTIPITILKTTITRRSMT